MMNYGNRNASSDYTEMDLAKGYLGAVVSSAGVALTSRKLLASYLLHGNAPSFLIINGLLNYLAAAIPGPINLAIMRWKEI